MTDGVEIAFATFFIAWTVAILGGLVWLERQFSAMRAEIVMCLTKEEYDKRHDGLEARLREAELCLRALGVKIGDKR